MCLSCMGLDFGAGQLGNLQLSRRAILRHAAAAGAALPIAAVSAKAGIAAAHDNQANQDFSKQARELIERARPPELAGYQFFEIDGADLPWKDLGLKAAKGQQITFLLTGRMWVSRQFDIWFAPGLVFHARTRGLRPMYSPGTDTGTMIAPHDGPLEIARSAAQFADEDGRLWTPENEYRKQDVKISGVALVWNGDAAGGLANLTAHGDVNGLFSAELERLQRNRKLPDGWSDQFMFGGGAETFNRAENGDILCDSSGRVSIIERPLPLAFGSSPKLAWRWNIEQLPSANAEDQAIFHDYLSIGVKFEDGQDLTYFWSNSLPSGRAFRCPLAGWNTIETHMVVDSGAENLGSWREVERDIVSDYAAHIGGPAKAVTHIWLLAVTPFQRRRGACRYADIRVTTADGLARRL